MYSAHNETAESRAGVLIWTGSTSIKYSEEESTWLPIGKHNAGFADTDDMNLTAYVIGMGSDLKIYHLSIQDIFKTVGK